MSKVHYSPMQHSLGISESYEMSWFKGSDRDLLPLIYLGEWSREAPKYSCLPERNLWQNHVLISILLRIWKVPSLHLDNKKTTLIEIFLGLYLKQPRPLTFHLTLPILFYLNQADKTATLNIKKIYTVQMV